MIQRYENESGHDYLTRIESEPRSFNVNSGGSQIDPIEYVKHLNIAEEKCAAISKSIAVLSENVIDLSKEICSQGDLYEGYKQFMYMIVQQSTDFNKHMAYVNKLLYSDLSEEQKEIAPFETQAMTNEGILGAGDLAKAGTSGTLIGIKNFRVALEKIDNLKNTYNLIKSSIADAIDEYKQIFSIAQQSGFEATCVSASICADKMRYFDESIKKQIEDLMRVLNKYVQDNQADLKTKVENFEDTWSSYTSSLSSMNLSLDGIEYRG